MFLWGKGLQTKGIKELQKAAAKGHKDEKRELARRLMEGDGVEKDEAMAVSLLEDCVILDDPFAMMMLAKCYASGFKVKQDAERADALVSEAAEKGNRELRKLIQLIKDWKWKNSIYLGSLRKFFFQ